MSKKKASKKTSTDTTAKERMNRRRDRLRAAGLVRREVWIDPNDPSDLKKLAALDRAKSVEL